MVDCGFREVHNMYFGDAVVVTETSINKPYVINGLDSGNRVVAAQLYALRKEDLLSKGRSVTKKRSNWVTIAYRI